MGVEILTAEEVQQLADQFADWEQLDRDNVAALLDSHEVLRARLEAAEKVIDAARLFRKADLGGGFNDIVQCGHLFDASIAAYYRAYETGKTPK